MALNCVMALILPYFTKVGSFQGALRKSGYVAAKNSSRSLSHRMSLLSCI